MSSQRSDWRERLHANPSRMEQELAIKLQDDGIHPRNADGFRVEESVDVEEVKPRDWAENDYQPDAVNNSQKLYKKPGYTMRMTSRRE